MKHTKIISVIFCFFCMCFQSNASTDGQIDSSNLFRNYIEEYGRLSLVGNQLYANGKSIQLKGWSTYTIDSCTECYTENAILKMKETGANVVRFAFPVNISLNSEKDKLFQNLYNYIDYAEKTGLFCVVDWHVEGGNPNNYYGENFLDSISLYVKKKNYKHVIYEICNEPGNIKWSEIKDYASRALSTIQYNDPSAVVIVGTPQWSQSFDEVINSPIESDSLNILYAFHYSACSHEQMLSNLKKAAKSIPVFVSEWSTSDWEGKIDSPCDKESLELMDVCEGNNDGFQKISWCALGWGDHNRSGSVAFRSCSDVNADDLYNSLLPSGQFVYSLLNPVQICCAAGVSDEEISSKAIFIYSNPSDGVFEVKLPTSEAAEVTIFNMIGEIVYQGLIENDMKISTNLSIGQYILVVKTENNVYNEKLVVR